MYRLFLRKFDILNAVRFLVLLNAFFLQSYLIRFSVFGYRTNLQEILLLGALGLHMFYLLKTGNFRAFLRRLWHYSIILLIFGFLLISSFLTLFVFPDIAFIDFLRFVKFFIFAFIFVLLFVDIFQTDHAKKHALEVMGLGALSFAAFSLLYNLFGYNAGFDYRLSGPLDSANYFAYYLAPFVIISFIALPCFTRREAGDFFSKVYNFITRYFKKTSYEAYYVFLLLFALMAMTRSVASISVILIVFLLFILKSHYDFLRKNNIYIFLLGAIVVFAVLFILFSRIIPAIHAPSSSFKERIEIWRTSNVLLQDPIHKIFGLGLGQFQYQYEKAVPDVLFGRNPLDFNVLQPHNIILLFWFNFGVLGLIFIVYIFYILLTDAFSSSSDYSFTTRSFFYVLIYFFLHGIVDAPIFKNDLLILFLLFLQLYFLQKQKNEKQSMSIVKFFTFIISILFFVFVHWLIILQPQKIPYVVNSLLLRKQMLFNDVFEGHPRFDAIKYMTDSGRILPYPDNYFASEKELYRGEFVSLVLKAGFYKDIDKFRGSCFRDVPVQHPFYAEICLAKVNGFVSGDQNGDFRPDWRISKAEAFKILAKVKNWSIPEAQPFDAVDWHSPYVQYVREKNLLEYDWDSFEYWHPITRGEFAEIWWRDK